MRKWLRRIRGAIGMGFTWGAAWSGAGIVLAVVTGFKADAPFPLIFGVLGFIAGLTFSRSCVDQAVAGLIRCRFALCVGVTTAFCYRPSAKARPWPGDAVSRPRSPRLRGLRFWFARWPATVGRIAEAEPSDSPTNRNLPPMPGSRSRSTWR
jgi:hypothetical protein